MADTWDMRPDFQTFNGPPMTANLWGTAGDPTQTLAQLMAALGYTQRAVGEDGRMQWGRQTEDGWKPMRSDSEELSNSQDTLNQQYHTPDGQFVRIGDRQLPLNEEQRQQLMSSAIQHPQYGLVVPADTYSQAVKHSYTGGAHLGPLNLERLGDYGPQAAAAAITMGGASGAFAGGTVAAEGAAGAGAAAGGAAGAGSESGFGLLDNNVMFGDSALYDSGVNSFMAEGVPATGAPGSLGGPTMFGDSHLGLEAGLSGFGGGPETFDNFFLPGGEVPGGGGGNSIGDALRRLLGGEGSGGGSGGGGSNFNPWALGAGLGALNYAYGQNEFDTSKLESAYDQITPAGLTGQFDINTGSGRNKLTSNLSRRGVMGSSFANQDLASFDMTRDVGRQGLLTGGATAQAGIANQILQTKIAEQKNKNDLIGRALLALSGVGNPRNSIGDLFNI